MSSLSLPAAGSHYTLHDDGFPSNRGPNRLQFSTLGGLLFGYDQGVVSGVITMESFAARFPRVYSDTGFKGWFVSTLLLGVCVVWLFFFLNFSLWLASTVLALGWHDADVL